MIHVDMTAVLNLWDGLELGSFNRVESDKEYKVEFISKSGEVVGYTRAVAGDGFYWDYPQTVIDVIQHLNNNYDYSFSMDVVRDYENNRIDDTELKRLISL